MHSIVSAFFSFAQWALTTLWICAVIYGIVRLAFYLFRTGGAGRPIGSTIILTLTGGLLLNLINARHAAVLQFVESGIGIVLLGAMAMGAIMLLADSFKPKTAS